MKPKDTKAQSHKERPLQAVFHSGLSLWLCAFVSLCLTEFSVLTSLRLSHLLEL